VHRVVDHEGQGRRRASAPKCYSAEMNAPLKVLQRPCQTGFLNKTFDAKAGMNAPPQATRRELELLAKLQESEWWGQARASSRGQEGRLRQVIRHARRDRAVPSRP